MSAVKLVEDKIAVTQSFKIVKTLRFGSDGHDRTEAGQPSVMPG